MLVVVELEAAVFDDASAECFGVSFVVELEGAVEDGRIVAYSSDGGLSSRMARITPCPLQTGHV